MFEPKRIALFLDGTWNVISNNTNVWRIKSLCQCDDTQVIYYSAGVGTQYGSEAVGGMFGYGLDQEVIDAYEWLVEKYNSGDEIYIFGFSRGAYTARSLSGFISKCGLLQTGSPISVDQLYDRYKKGCIVRTIRELTHDKGQKRGTFTTEENWMLKYSAAVPVKFIGVWDTVGALGVPFGNIPFVSRSKYQFLETDLRINNDFAYHALAIDEHREAFAPTLWTKTTPTNSTPNDSYPSRPVKDVEQRWFVGAHANVGGGYANDLLAQLPLQWLVDRAQLHGLRFKHGASIDGDENTAPLTDSFSEFAWGTYKIAKLGRSYYRPIGIAPIEIPTSVTNTINETIDWSVFNRWQKDKTYRPKNLDAWAKKQKVDITTLRQSVMANDPSITVPDLLASNGTGNSPQSSPDVANARIKS